MQPQHKDGESGSEKTATSGRIIGIQHRVKKTKTQAAHPTIVCILDPDGKRVIHELPDLESESDFILSRFPVEYRLATSTVDEAGVEQMEDLSSFKPWHILRDDKKGTTKVPTRYDGIKPNDTVVMVLGGSGDNLAYAILKIGKETGVKMFRIAPYKLCEERGDGKKTEDAKLLVDLASKKPHLFENCRPRDERITEIRALTRNRLKAMKARIATEQVHAATFESKYYTQNCPEWREAGYQSSYEADAAADPGLKVMRDKEEVALKDLAKGLERCDIFLKLFKPIVGMGPAISSRIISQTNTILRFSKASKYRKYCGVHVNEDGTFPRRESGKQANWDGSIRQALWLLSDQFNRRPGTPWGKRLVKNKEYYKKKHPNLALRYAVDGKEVLRELIPGTFTKKINENKSTSYIFHDEGGDVVLKGSLDYTKKHIHRMGVWKTLSEFVDWLYDNWWNIERDQAVVEPDVWFAANEQRRTDYEAHIADLNSSRPTESLDSEGSVEEAA